MARSSFSRYTRNLKNMPYIDVDDVTKAFASEAFAHANIKAFQLKKGSRRFAKTWRGSHTRKSSEQS